MVIDHLLHENSVLRAKLGPKRLRFTDRERRRLARTGQRLGRKALREFTQIAHPDTILRWYRELVAKKYDGSKKRGPGRPRIRPEVERLILSMAEHSPSWGYHRIQGALKHLGYTLVPNTVKRVLIEHGLDLSRKRSARTEWKTFIASHIHSLAACDFFTVEMLTWRGLVRYWVFFVIRLETRQVKIVALTPNISGTWVHQQMRNLTDCEDGFLRDATYLIMDRDPVFTQEVRECLRATGVEPVRMPPRSPNLNAYAERFVRSVKTECLSKIIPLGERHLRHVLKEYELHYNQERPHQGIENELVTPRPLEMGTITRTERLGGVLQSYAREAA